jgi:dihydroorotase-like cyclic amidohydrolase
MIAFPFSGSLPVRLALLLLLISAASLADTTRHVVIFQDKVSGSMTTTTEKDATKVVFTYRDNGRGPDIYETIRVAPDGTIAEYRVKGKSTFGAPIAESFKREGARARWQSHSDRGEVTVQKPAIYVPVENSFEIGAITARALLKQPSLQLDALPGGQMRIEKLAELTLKSGSKEQPVALYNISGLDLAPSFQWLTLDDAQRFFAFVYPGYVRVIEEEWREQAQELEKAQVAAEEKLLDNLNARLTHDLPTPILLRNVNVFDSERAQLSGPRDVYVEHGRIAAIYPANSKPHGARTIIDGAGRTLLPGLFDMHTHESAWSALLQIAGGVTTSRDMANDNAVLDALRTKIDAGKAIGPRILPAGFIEGESEHASQGGFVVKNLDEVRDAIDWYAQRGYTQLKFYNSFKPEWVEPAAAYAHERGLRVGGHIPAFMRAEEAVRAGYDEIQHTNQAMLNFFVGPKDDTRTLARFYLIADHAHALDLKSQRVLDFIALLKERGTTVDATLATFEAMFTQRQGEPNPSFGVVAEHMPMAIQRGWRTNSMDVSAANAPRYRASFAKMLDFVKALHDAGIEIVAGTDEIAGFTLHRELELYVKAGIPAAEALRIATWNGAKVTGTSDRLGAVAPHKSADLILVDGDPTRNISDLRRVSLVMREGKTYLPAEVYEAIGVRRFADPPRIEKVN